METIKPTRDTLVREMLAAEMTIRNLIVRYAPDELRHDLDLLAKQACLAHQYAIEAWTRCYIAAQAMQEVDSRYALAHATRTTVEEELLLSLPVS